jgi:hypothetical protein
MTEGKGEKSGNWRTSREGFVIYAKSVALGLVFVLTLGVFTGAIVNAAGVQSSVDYSLFSRVVSWTSNVFDSIIGWVEEQSSKVAKAIVKGSDVTETEPSVLGETTENILEETAEEIPPDLPEEFVVDVFYNSQLIEQSPSIIEATAGVDQTLSVTYKNLSDLAWNNQNVSLNLVFEEEAHPLKHNTWITDRRPQVTEGIVPIEDAYEFNFLVNVPVEPGVYTLVVRPVVFSNGSFGWIGDSSTTASWSVRVLAADLGDSTDFADKTEEEYVKEIEEVQSTKDKVQNEEGDKEEKQTLNQVQGDAGEEKKEEAVEEVEPKKSNANLPVLILSPDGIAPTSAVNELATTTRTASFTVSWTGEDNETGDDISYDIEYKVDSGDWQSWLEETVLMSSLFTGSDESTYAFRSRGRDYVPNLEGYPDSEDAYTYVNLTVPSDPIVTSHSTTTTESVTGNDDEDGATGGLQVTLSGTGDANDTLSIALAETSVTATTTVSVGGTWSQQFSLATTTNSFTLQSSEEDGDESSEVLFSLAVEPMYDVVINEIAWMGTASDDSDEWIELYNASSTAVSLSNWTLSASDGTPDITLSGTIAANDYFILERTASTTVSDVSEDQIYSGDLGNTRELLTLANSSNLVMDQAGSSTVDWFFGDNSSAANRATMERKDPISSGIDSDNWATNDETLVNGQDADLTNLKATPGSLNSVNTTIPRTISDLQFQYIYTTSTSVKAYWTAPKTADLATTTPATYDLRYSTAIITSGNFDSATQATGEPSPSSTEGTVHTHKVSGLTANTTYYFAVKTNNGSATSTISNIRPITTLQAGGASYTTLGFGSDTVSVDTTVASSSSPYYIDRNFSINSGVTLTIEAGTVIKMNTSGASKGCNTTSLTCTITVNGTLVMGSTTDPINAVVITSRDDDTYGGVVSTSDGTPTAGDWGRILAGSATSNLDFDNSIIRYGGLSDNMIAVQGSAQANIASSTLEYSNTYGIAIAADATQLTITDSTIQNNANGIGVSTLANLTVSGTTFTANRSGILIAAPGDSTNISLTGNNFYANNTAGGNNSGVQYGDTDLADALDDGQITNNWWGSASGPTQDTQDTNNDTDGLSDDLDGTLTYITWPTLFSTTQFDIKPSGL